MRVPVWFRDTSIRRKFISIAFMAIGAAMLVAILLSTAIQWSMLRAEQVKSLFVQASVIAQNGAVELVSNDRNAAGKTLNSLAAIDDIEFAEILDKNGNDFALYLRPGVAMPRHQHLASKSEFHIETIKYIEVSIPIISKREQLGWIHVRSSVVPVYIKLSIILLSTIGTTTVACGIAVLILLRLLPAIIDPLQYLVHLTNKVSLDNDFSLRAEVYNKDEIGILANGFNTMLAHIQKRDTALLQYRQHLEEEIVQRTAELLESNTQLEKELAERNATEQKFKDSNEQLSILVDLLPIAVYRCRADDFSVMYMSHNVLSFTGYESKDFIENADLWLTHIHPDDAARVTNEITRLFELGTYSYEYRWLSADGTYLRIQDSLKLIQPEDGSPSYMVGMWQDITVRKQLELRLHESEQRFRDLAELTTDWIWQVDEHGTYVYSGVKVHSLLGYDPEEVCGKTPFDFMPAEEATRVSEIFKNIVSNKIPFSHLENINLHKNGHEVILETSGVPLIDDNGVFHGYFGTECDITARKHAENEIKLLATTDSLTGIANRREFNLQLEKEIERARRYNAPLSLVMYDIDHFKRVNDTFGHDAGDYVLKALTAIVKANIRAVDIVARWGGEEFMILMPQSDENAAGIAAEKLRKRIEQHYFEQVGNLTVSFGMTSFAINDDSNIFLKRVDDALYRAKEGGRNRVELLRG